MRAEESPIPEVILAPIIMNINLLRSKNNSGYYRGICKLTISIFPAVHGDSKKIM